MAKILPRISSHQALGQNLLQDRAGRPDNGLVLVILQFLKDDIAKDEAK